MPHTTWRDAYKDALMELDPMKLPQRIEAARKAIHDHITENRESLSKREFDDIDGALRILRFLMREVAQVFWLTARTTLILGKAGSIAGLKT